MSELDGPTDPRPYAYVVQAVVRAAMDRGAKSCRSLRTVIEENSHFHTPAKSHPDHIPFSRAAAIVWGDRPRKARHSQYVRAGLRFEHSVPMSVVFRKLTKVIDDLDAVSDIIDRYYQIVWVTQDEDARLSSLKLSRKMPANWDGLNGFARYDAAGIELDGGN